MYYNGRHKLNKEITWDHDVKNDTQTPAVDRLVIAVVTSQHFRGNIPEHIHIYITRFSADIYPHSQYKITRILLTSKCRTSFSSYSRGRQP